MNRSLKKLFIVNIFTVIFAHAAEHHECMVCGKYFPAIFEEPGHIVPDDLPAVIDSQLKEASSSSTLKRKLSDDHQHVKKCTAMPQEEATPYLTKEKIELLLAKWQDKQWIDDGQLLSSMADDLKVGIFVLHNTVLRVSTLKRRIRNYEIPPALSIEDIANYSKSHLENNKKHRGYIRASRSKANAKK